MPDRVASFFTAEPVRVTAFLRLPLIALVAVLVWIWEVDHWLPGVDVLVVVVLCLVSGGATAALLPVFFLLPIAVAFQDRPTLTALLGIGTALGYPAVWIVYSRRDDSVGLPDVVYTEFGFLLWSAVATTALCVVLVRRQARVIKLLDVRRQLVSEAMAADERHNREVAERLHDGPLQTLLAARLDLDEVRERADDPRSKRCTPPCSRPPPRCARP